MAKAKEKAPSTTPSKKYQFYSGGNKNRKECPKCGKGVFLGEYKNPDRMVCGRCSYTEIDGKEVKREEKTVVPELKTQAAAPAPKQEAPKPEPKPEPTPEAAPAEEKVEEKVEEVPATSESEDANASDEQAEESEEKKE